MPPFEAPDEPAHLRYALFIAERGELPNQLDPARRVDGQGHQGPLHYALMAAVIRAVAGDEGLRFQLRVNPAHTWHGGSAGVEVPFFIHDGSPFATDRDRALFYGLRLLSVGLGLASLLVVARTVALLTDDAATRFLAVLLPATLPQFAFVSSYVTADNLIIFLAAVTVHALVRVVRSPERLRPYAGLGAALGLALLVKKTALFLGPGIALVLAALVAMRRASPRSVVRGAALAFAIVLLVAGGLFVRSQLLYGELLGDAMERATMPWLVSPRSLGDPYFRDLFPRLFSASFVGLLGWMNVWLSPWVYWFYGALGVVVAIGVLLRLRDPWTLVAGLFVALCLAGVIVYNMTFPQPQGRYLFAALPFVAYLAAGGLATVLHRTGVAPWPAIAVLAAVLVAVDVQTLTTVAWFFGPR